MASALFARCSRRRVFDRLTLCNNNTNTNNNNKEQWNNNNAFAFAVSNKRRSYHSINRSAPAILKPSIVAQNECCRRLLVVSSLYTRRSEFHNSAARFGKTVQFNLSDIGEGIAEVQIKEWHVKVGDHVSQFDNLCEVQSDKASVTITSRYDGIVKKLYYAVDDVAPTGKPLLDIELDGEGGAVGASGEESEAPTKRDDYGDGDGDSSGASSSDDDDASRQHAPGLTSGRADVGAADDHKVLATPAVRRIAMENKVNLAQVAGSGKDGRVLKEDVLKFIGQLPGPAASPTVEDRAARLLHELSPLKADRLVPIKGYMRIMVKTMSEANKIPHFGYMDEVNVDRLVDLRDQLKSMAHTKGTKMTYMPLFIKAASLALIQYPVLNASVDSTLDNVTYKSSHNVCVAIDTPGGLVVPNIKHCEQRNLWEIAVELNRLQALGMKQQLSQADLQDGTFTLSNIGAIGGTYASPVIFPPQVTIGALGKIEKLPRYDRHMNVHPTRMVKVSWAADHRVVDGATMARFSNLWKEYLEHPALMIAEMR